MNPPAGPIERLLDLIHDMRPAWFDRAACRGVGPEPFFPEVGRPTHADHPARRWCDHCPVTAECADRGANELHGLWGNLTVRDRRHIRNQKARTR